MQGTAQILREAAQGASEAFDRANKGWGYYIRGIERVRHDPSGAQFNRDRDIADKLVKSDPTHLFSTRRSTAQARAVRIPFRLNLAEETRVCSLAPCLLCLGSYTRRRLLTSRVADCARHGTLRIHMVAVPVA